MRTKQNQPASYFIHSLTAPKLIGKSYLSIIVAGICISVVSLILNLIYGYFAETFIPDKKYDLSSVWSLDWWQWYIQIYIRGVLSDLFHHLFCAVIVFTLWKIREIKHVLPGDIARSARYYLQKVIVLTLIVYLLFIVSNTAYEIFIDLSFLGNLEIYENRFIPWSAFIKSNFFYPIFTFLFVICLSAMLIKKLNPFQAIYEIWKFLNLAPVWLILISYVFIVISRYVPNALVNLIRTPFYLSQMESGYNAGMMEGIATTLVFNSMSGLIFMILFAIPCAAIVQYYINEDDRSVE